MKISVKPHFLDLAIEVHDRKFITRKFTTMSLNNRDDLSFYINYMPYLYSNVPSKLFYAPVGSNIMHIAMTKTDQLNVKTHVNLSLI